MADKEQIVFLQNYFHKFDPQNYYKNDKNEFISLRTKRAVPYLPVYVSDLIDQNDCDIYFGKYRNNDDDYSHPIIKDRTGVVHSYNPKTNLLETISQKKKPIINRFNKKMRYVEPESAILNLSRNCAITQTNCDKKPECLKQLNHLVEEKYKTSPPTFKSYRSFIKTQNGTGKRSKRNTK